MEPVLLGNAAALEAEVARRRAKDGGAAADRSKSTRSFVHIGDVLQPALDDLLRRHNIPIPKNAEEREELLRSAEKNARDELEAVRKAARERRWDRICEEEFRKPFDRARVPKSVSEESLRKVLHWKFGPKGLHVIGASGMCKTRAVFIMLRKHYIEGKTIIFRDGIDFALDASAAFGEPSRTQKWLADYVRADIVFIDDLAKRFKGTTAEAFFAILDKRGAAQRPTIITTNCTGDQLAAMVGDSTLSDPIRRRQREYCEVVVFES